MTEETETEAEWGINLQAVDCPKCGQRMPALRVPDSLHQLMWGAGRARSAGAAWTSGASPSSLNEILKL